MGWEHIFAGLLAGWIVDRHEQKKEQKAQLQQRTYPVPGVPSVSERLFVNARNKTLTVTYQPVCADTMENLNLYNNAILKDEQRGRLHYYYSRVEMNPTSFEARSEIIHFLLKIWKDDANAGVIELLQNELLYLIDYMKARTQQERMYQHLAMFLSAECYFFKGEFSKALKRLYQVLDWQEIYDNVDDRDGIDFNGLCNFHEATVSNIINLYALVGLVEKTDEVRSACRKLIGDAQESYNYLMERNKYDANMRKFLQGKYDMLMATNGLQGYYLISDTAYRSNLFKESVTTVIRGQAIYAIETLPFDYSFFSVVEGTRVINGENVKCRSLCMSEYGEIENYEAAICRERVEMRAI